MSRTGPPAPDAETAAEGSAVPFACECGSPECQETVSLSLAAYEALRRTNRPILAPGHEVDRGHETHRTKENVAAARVQKRGRVLVVDDSEIFQQVGRTLVSEARGLHLVGVAASGEEAIALLAELKPDLVLLDVHMPGIGGLEAARVIRRESPETMVVLVSADPAGVAADAPSTGAAAFLTKVELSSGKLEELWLEHVASG